MMTTMLIAVVQGAAIGRRAAPDPARGSSARRAGARARSEVEGMGRRGAMSNSTLLGMEAEGSRSRQVMAANKSHPVTETTLTPLVANKNRLAMAVKRPQDMAASRNPPPTDVKRPPDMAANKSHPVTVVIPLATAAKSPRDMAVSKNRQATASERLCPVALKRSPSSHLTAVVAMTRTSMVGGGRSMVAEVEGMGVGTKLPRLGTLMVFGNVT